ncbi:MAG TPA: ATP-binding protein [Cellulomonadaceae bacterium]|nr:ATP-binding protein [Cellulomonadaceae bacterium]
MSARPTTMMRALAACVHGNVPALVKGGPGVGKTAKLEAVGNSWGHHVETISAGSREAVDFMGLPMEKDDEVVYSTLSWAKRLAAATKGLLVVDEITTAQSTFKAFLRILQERYVGEFHLPDSVAIVAICNPPEIAVDGVDLPAPVANRFIHLDWHLDRVEWLDNVGTGFADVPTAAVSTYLTAGANADRARAVNLVTGFLRFRPDLLDAMPTDPDAQSGAWPSPRSWTNAIDALTWVPTDDDDARDMILIGAVGKPATVQLLTWLAMSDLHDPVAVLANPNIVGWTTERPDRLFALLGAIITLAALEGDATTWRQALRVTVACARAGRPDVAMPAARTLANSPHGRDGVPADFKDAFSDLFIRTGQVVSQAVAA